MTFASAALWILLLAAAVTCAYWHYHANKALLGYAPSSTSPAWRMWIRRLAQTHTLHLIILLAAYSLLLICYDWQLQQSKSTVLSLDAARLDLESQNAALKLQNTDFADLMYSTLQASAAEAEASAEPQPVILNGGQNSVLDVYNPEESLPGNQPAMDSLKKRHAEILVTHLFLRKCKIAQPLDYHDIVSALSQEMASVNAPGRLQYDIVTAAQGSYKEMYAQSNCKGENMDALRAQYSAYINGLSKNFPAPQ